MRTLLAIIPALFISSQAAALYGEELPTEVATIVYVIDCSCSMDSGWSSFVGVNGQQMSGYRMDRAKAEVIASITDLDEDYRIDVVASVEGGSALYAELAPADDRTREDATGWIGGLAAAGSTGTGPAVAWALQNPGYGDAMHFVVITDGAPDCLSGDEACIDPLDTADWIDELNERGARIDVVLLGPDEEDDDPWVFGETVTGDSGGTLTVVD